MKQKIEKLEKELAELKNELAEFEKSQQTGKWQDKLVQPIDEDRDYYFITSNVGEGLMVGRRHRGGMDRKPEHAFATEEQAELVKEKMLLMQEMFAFAHSKNEGWKPDWNTGEQKKWGIDVCKNVPAVASYCWYTNGYIFGITVKSKEIAEEMRDIFGERIKKYYNEQY